MYLFNQLMILCRYIYAYSMLEANMLCNHDQSIEFELQIYIYINISYTCLMYFYLHGV